MWLETSTHPASEEESLASVWMHTAWMEEGLLLPLLSPEEVNYLSGAQVKERLFEHRIKHSQFQNSSVALPKYGPMA